MNDAVAALKATDLLLAQLDNLSVQAESVEAEWELVESEWELDGYPMLSRMLSHSFFFKCNRFGTSPVKFIHFVALYTTSWWPHAHGLYSFYSFQFMKVLKNMFGDVLMSTLD